MKFLSSTLLAAIVCSSAVVVAYARWDPHYKARDISGLPIHGREATQRGASLPGGGWVDELTTRELNDYLDNIYVRQAEIMPVEILVRELQTRLDNAKRLSRRSEKPGMVGRLKKLLTPGQKKTLSACTVCQRTYENWADALGCCTRRSDQLLAPPVSQSTSKSALSPLTPISWNTESPLSPSEEGSNDPEGSGKSSVNSGSGVAASGNRDGSPNQEAVKPTLGGTQAKPNEAHGGPSDGKMKN